MLPRNTTHQTGRRNWFTARETRQSRASRHSLEPDRERSKTATYPRPASRQRTSPPVAPREQGSSGRGHLALESHCTVPADDARAGGIVYWTCHWFSNGFPRGCCFHGPPSSLLICPLARNHTRDQKAQHGTREMLYSWGAELGMEVGYCHRRFYFWVIFSWGVCGHHRHEVRGEGLDLEGRGFEFKRYTSDLCFVSWRVTGFE